MKVATGGSWRGIIVPMDQIYYEADREHGGDGDIPNLAKSMEKFGLIQAIVVHKEDDDRYRIITGRRRFEAARLLGWAEIKADLRTAEDAEAVSLAENVNREEMNPLDEAILFQKQLADGRDINELAQYYNRSVSAIYQRIRLTRLTDKVRGLFQAGKIKITAAAMLAALDEKLQHKFWQKYNNWSSIEISHVESFLHSVQRNTLTCVTDKKCAACTTRTNHSDKNLFPEYNGLQDICFNDDCYAKKWLALLARELKKGKAEYPDTENILVIDSGIPTFYRGDTLTVDKTEYRIKKYDYKNRTGDKDKNGFYAWEFTIDYEDGKPHVYRRRYKEIKKEGKKAGEKKSEFEIGGIVSAIADETIEKENPGGKDVKDKTVETKRIDQALGKQFESSYHLKGEIKFALIKHFAQAAAAKSRTFTRELIARQIDPKYDTREHEHEKELYEIVTGLPCTEGFPGIETVDPQKIITLLFVLETLSEGDYNFPSPDNPDAEDDCLAYQLSGLPQDQFMDLYNTTAREIIQNALRDPDSPEGESPSEDMADDGQEEGEEA